MLIADVEVKPTVFLGSIVAVGAEGEDAHHHLSRNVKDD